MATIFPDSSSEVQLYVEGLRILNDVQVKQVPLKA